MICFRLSHVPICSWFLCSAFSLTRDCKEGGRVHHTSSETGCVAHFVNQTLHSTLYSTLLIYSVKAYFKKKPHCVYLSKFIGLRPIISGFKSKRNERCFRMLEVEKGGGDNRVFTFSFLEHSFCVLRPFDSCFVSGVYMKSLCSFLLPG